jgi:delta(3,5)-delta(2,4)-dienoyl-CoA isomerase
MAASLRALIPVLRRAGSVVRCRQLSTGRVAMGEGLAVTDYVYGTLAVSQPRQWVVEVRLNRPEKRNAMNQAFWREMVDCFQRLSEDSSCRVVVLTGEGHSFTSGLDLVDFAPMFTQFQTAGGDVARRTVLVRRLIQPMQDTFSAIEKCMKPVIACVHSACVGGGVDMITACDIRLCSRDAWFQVKEVDLGLAADVGTLQRLPKVVGNSSWVRDVVFTARRVSADEAFQFGLVSQVCDDRETAMSTALQLAEKIASKSPVAVLGSKVNLNYSRDHTVQEGLDFAVVWNSTMLQSEDVGVAISASVQKETPVFSKL